MQTVIGNGEFVADWTRGTQTASGVGNFSERGISPLPLGTQPVVLKPLVWPATCGAGAQGYGIGAGAPVVGVQCRLGAAALTSWASVITITAGELSSSGGL